MAHVLFITPFYPPEKGAAQVRISETAKLLVKRGYQSFDLSRFVRCQVVLDGRKVLCRETIESQGMRYIAIGDGNLREVICQGGEYTFHSVGLHRGGRG